MTKFDRRYMDPEAYADLQADVDLVEEWRGKPRDAWRDALNNRNIGGQVEATSVDNLVVADAATFRPKEICRVQLPAELSRAWTVSWSTPLLPAAGTFFGFPIACRSYGVLQWGAGSFQHQALFDWRAGGQVTVYGSYIALLVQPFGLTAGITARYGGSLAPGLAPPRPVCYTDYTGAIAIAGTFTRSIPAFAEGVLFSFLTAAPQASDSYSLEMLRIGSVLFARFPTLNSSSATVWDRTQFIPLPGETMQVRISNTSGVAIADSQLIYRLAI